MAQPKFAADYCLRCDDEVCVHSTQFARCRLYTLRQRVYKEWQHPFYHTTPDGEQCTVAPYDVLQNAVFSFFDQGSDVKLISETQDLKLSCGLFCGKCEAFIFGSWRPILNKRETETHVIFSLPCASCFLEDDSGTKRGVVEVRIEKERVAELPLDRGILHIPLLYELEDCTKLYS